jgi:XTP/dITP diphosphohydrolase
VIERTLLLGTGNKDKAAELRTLLEGLPWRVVTLAAYPEMDEPEEDQDTFEGNALLKARYYGRRLGLWCAADDSGLVVDALDGRPGVYSARYAGPGCAYADNNAKVLRELDGAPPAERTARFVCCAALAGPDGHEHTETGTVEGRIAEAERGHRGFGYDPLFIPEGYEQTFGELPADVKHALSHRGEAFRRLRDHLASLA